MSNILNGIPREAIKGQGGLKRVWLAKLSDIGSQTETAGIADFTCPAGAFKEYKLPKESGSNLAETITGNVAAGVYSTEQLITMVFNRNTVSKRNEITILAQEELVGIVEDNNGEVYVCGLFNGLDLTSGAGASGANVNEGNNFTVTLRGQEKDVAPSLAAADYSAIKNGTALI